MQRETSKKSLREDEGSEKEGEKRSERDGGGVGGESQRKGKVKRGGRAAENQMQQRLFRFRSLSLVAPSENTHTFVESFLPFFPKVGGLLDPFPRPVSSNTR